MSDVKKFDTHIKDQFADYSANVSPHIWDNIMKERENRKPAGFWVNFLSVKNIAIIAGVLFASGTSFWAVNRNQSNSQSSSSYTTEKSSENKTSSEDVSLVTKNNDEKNIVAYKPTNLNNTSQTTGSQPSVMVNDNIVTNSLKTSSNTIQSTERVHNSTSKHTTHKAGSIIYKSTDGDQTIDNTEDVVAGSSDQSLIKADIPTTALSTERMPWNVQKIVAFNSMKQSVTKRTFPNIHIPDCPTMEKDIAGNKRYIEVYAGPDYAIRSLTDTNAAYLQKRKETTKFAFAYSAGIRYTKVFRNGISVRGGVNYSQINEKFTYVESNIVQTVYVIDPVSGDTTGHYTTSGARYKTTYNRYRSFDIPVVLGYELGNGRLHANINAGAIINIYSWQKGDILDSLNKPVSITTGSKGNPDYQYKTHMGVGFTGGVSLYYKLTDQLHLLAEPYVRYNISPMNDNTISLKQKYTTVGLRLGVRVDL